MLGLAERGQMGVDDRGDGALMAQVDLELAQVFALLQKVRGVRMTQRMDMHALFNATGLQGEAEGALQRGAAHRLFGGRRPQAALAFGREEPARMPMGEPNLAQPLERALGQGHVAITVALPTSDVQAHAFGVDVADLEVEGFPQPQAAGIDRSQGDAMIHGLDQGEQSADFLGREDDGQLELGVGADKLQFRGPGALEGFLPEDFDGAEGLGGGLAGQATFLEVDEIVPEFLGGEFIGRAAKVLAQLADTSPVALLGTRQQGQQSEVIAETF